MDQQLNEYSKRKNASNSFLREAKASPKGCIKLYLLDPKPNDLTIIRCKP
jgi:hypothetical protein